MDDFLQKIAGDKTLSVDEQIQAGTPIAGSIGDEYKGFLQTLKTLLDEKHIDPFDPKSFLNMDVYSRLPEDVRDKADLILVNLAHQVRLIADFLASDHTPEESPQLMTMVQQLWQTKQQIEKDYDVFKF